MLAIVAVGDRRVNRRRHGYAEGWLYYGARRAIISRHYATRKYDAFSELERRERR